MWSIWVGDSPFRDLTTRFANNYYGFVCKLHKASPCRRPELKRCSRLPEQLKGLMCQCWSHEPDARPQSFNEILKVLEELKDYNFDRKNELGSTGESI